MPRALLLIALFVATPAVTAAALSSLSGPPGAGAAWAAQATPVPKPAPTEDRVGFPDGYDTAYRVLFVYDRPDNKQVRVIYGNEQAAAVKAGEPFPYGSILVMETWRAKLGADGNPELDAQGRYQRDEAAGIQGIFVQRKERGFGEAYLTERSGEWEYVAFRPDRSYSQPPQNTNACARCHQDAGATRDWVFRMDLFHYNKSGAVPQAPAGLVEAGRGLMQSYLFLPNPITIKRGTTFTWSNEDEAVHTVTADDGSFDSGRLGLGATYGHTFDQAGTFAYSCTIHPPMKASIVVEE
jgi:plastocyanin